MKYYLLSILAFLLLIPRAQEVSVVNSKIDTLTTTLKVDTLDTIDNIELEEFPLFDFNTFEIEMHEGCTDSLVYPGGISGPTIACGLDLGNAGANNVSKVLKSSVSDEQYELLMKAVKIRGEDSRDWIRRNQVHLGERTAKRICNSLKKHIWRLLTAKYQNLETAPAPVKTAVLDIAFQAGVGSIRMNGFGSAIEAKNWMQLAYLISNSYSDFEGGKYHSIYRRRVDHAKQIEFMYNPPKNVAIDYD